MKVKLLLTISIGLFLTACGNQQQQRDGQAIYYQSCVSCHERGHGGAPMRGDTKAWQERMEKGQAVLFRNLKDGYNTMPAKGACFDCSDKELELVLDYLINK